MPFLILTWHLQNGSRLRRYVIPESRAVSLLSRDLRDAHLQALLGGGHSHRSSNTATTTTNIYADPLLSSFGLGFATSDIEEPSKSPVPVLDDPSKLKEMPPQPWESRYIIILVSGQLFYLFCSSVDYFTSVTLAECTHFLWQNNLPSQTQSCLLLCYKYSSYCSNHCVPNILVVVPTDSMSLHLEIICLLLLEISPSL